MRVRQRSGKRKGFNSGTLGDQAWERTGKEQGEGSTATHPKPDPQEHAARMRSHEYTQTTKACANAIAMMRKYITSKATPTTNKNLKRQFDASILRFQRAMEVVPDHEGTQNQKQQKLFHKKQEQFSNPESIHPKLRYLLSTERPLVSLRL